MDDPDERMIRLTRLAAVLIGLLGGCVQSHEAREDAQAPIKPSSQVEKLFESMREGRYKEPDFPKLTWEDIRSLLSFAENTNALRSFPRNPLSSQFEAECSEGMIALWLIEGIRESQPAQFPSLNALCFSRFKTQDEDWTEHSRTSHPRALAFYRKWWAEIASQSKTKGMQTNPLEGSDLYWY